MYIAKDFLSSYKKKLKKKKEKKDGLGYCGGYDPKIMYWVLGLVRGH